MSWLVAVVGLLLLVLIHEAGHFVVALAVGMRPRKFYVGFPPAMAKKTIGGVEYGIGAIPLGGYVRIPGMHRPAARDVQVNFAPALDEAPELRDALEAFERHLEAGDHDAARNALGPLVAALRDARLSRLARKSAERGLRDLEESLAPDAYWRQDTWRRVAVIFAGPAVNVVFAIAIFTIAFAVGIVGGNTRDVTAVSAGTPAAAIGLRSGDVVVAVNGKPTGSFDAMRERIQASRGRPIALTVQRHGRRVTLPAHRPILSGKRWILGFQPGVSYTSYPVGTSFGKSLDQCWLAIKGTGQAIAGLFHKKERGQLTSTVGIVEASHTAVQLGFRVYLPLLAYISLALAILNLLPLLPLDGGHILFSIIEGVRRRAVAREVYERASVIGFALILLVFFIALNNDLGGGRPG